MQRTQYHAVSDFNSLSKTIKDSWNVNSFKHNVFKFLIYIEYFMESARVRCLHTNCGVSEIEQVSEANE